jgi:ubiquinone biosynthesis protein
MVGRIDEQLREQFEDLLLLLLQGDAAGLSDLLLRLGSAPGDVDRSGFQTDISELLLDVGTVSLQDLDLSATLEQISDILRRYHIVMPSRVALLLKTLVMLEGTSRVLSATFSLAELLEPLKERLIRERLEPRRLLKKLLRPARDLDRLLTQTPRNLADILDNLQSGKLTIKHEIERLDTIVNRAIAGLLLATLFTGSSLLLSRGFPPLVSGVSVFGALGCLTAAVLGGRFLWIIRHDLQ